MIVPCCPITPSPFGESGRLITVADLPTTLTINSTAQAAECRYSGIDAASPTWAAWTLGSDVTLQAGTAPTFGQPGYTGTSGAKDGAVQFNAGGYYQAANSNIYDPSNTDMVWRILAKTPPSGGWVGLASKAFTDKGWLITLHTNYIGLWATFATTWVGPVTSAALTADTWYDFMIFWCRGNSSAQVYVNGARTGTGGVLGDATSIANLGTFLLGTGQGQSPAATSVAYYASWQRASWLDTHQQDAVAAAQHAFIA